MLTLSQISILLHYYYSPEEHADCQANSRAWRSAVDGLVREELLKPNTTRDGSASYQTTDRAAVYVEAIRALPLPVQSWAMPAGAVS